LIFAAWSKVEPLEAALNFMQLGLFCLNLNNTYCIINVNALQNTSAYYASLPNGGQCNTFTDQPTCVGGAQGCTWSNSSGCSQDFTSTQGRNLLNTVCHPCIGAFIHRSVALLDLMDVIGLPDNGTQTRAQERLGFEVTLFFRAGICSTDLSNNFCLPEIQSEPNPDFSNICNALATMKSNVGCCAASYFDFSIKVCYMAVLLAAAQNQTNNCTASVAQIQLALSTCADATPPVNLGQTCAAIKFSLGVKLVVSGLAAAWWQAAVNQQTLLNTIQQIVAFNGGVDPQNVTVSSPNQGRRLLQGAPVTVTAAISVGSSTDATAVMGGLSPTSNLETLTLTQNTQAQGLSGVQVTSQGVTNGPGPTSSAPTLVVGAVTAVIAAVGCMLV